MHRRLKKFKINFHSKCTCCSIIRIDQSYAMTLKSDECQCKNLADTFRREIIGCQDFRERNRQVFPRRWANTIMRIYSHFIPPLSVRSNEPVPSFVSHRYAKQQRKIIQMRRDVFSVPLYYRNLKLISVTSSW